MKQCMRARLLNAAGLSLIAAWAGPAFAQVPAADPGVVPQREEVVVTAQRRSERLQDVPLSIQAVSADTLERANVDDALALSRLVPNFAVTRAPAAANTQIRMRGIGAAGNTGVDPSVAVFLDGVYNPRPSALLASFLDVASVEVVRGPQGTLFGRNTTAGGLLLRTAAPEPDRLFYGLIEGGDFGSSKAEAVVNLPLTDTLAVRASLQATSLDGYGTNLLNGADIGRRESAAGRLALRADYTDALRSDFRLDYSHLTGDGQVAVDILSSSVTPAMITALTTRLGAANLPDVRSSFDRKVRQFTGGDLKDIQFGGSHTLTLDLDSGYAVKLISGFRDYDNSQFDQDAIYLPIQLTPRRNGLRSESRSHELQLVSPPDGVFDGRLRFVAGLYVFDETFALDEDLSITDAFCGLFAPAGAQRNACLAGPRANVTQLRFTQDASSSGIFGQADLQLIDTLTAVVGIRHSKDEKTGAFVQTAATPFLAAAVRAPETTALKIESDKTTYRLGLNWTPATDLLVFASFATGYKAGGFNSGGGLAVLGAARRTFQPEEAENIELGVKSQFFDRRLTVNATLYQTDLDNFQERSFDGQSFTVQNAGSLRSRGVEMDGVWRISPALSITGAYAYLDAKFTRYVNGSALPGCAAASPALAGCGPVGANRTIRNLSGQRLRSAPEHTASLQVRYDRQVGDWRLGADLGANYVSEQFIGGVTDANPQTLQKGYGLLNGRLSLAAPGDRWRVSLFGENLSGTDYCAGQFYQPNDNQLGLRDPTTGFTLVRCTAGAPRTWGASLSASF